jgi:hypothetical protein
MNSSFSTAFGYTQTELEDNFDQEIKLLAEKEETGLKDTLKRIRQVKQSSPATRVSLSRSSSEALRVG